MIKDLMRLNIYTNPEGGYIALISAIIISVLLLAITFTLSFTAFYSRFNVLDSEFKKVSSALAEACVNSAMLRIANDSSYTLSVEDELTFDPPANTKKCKIISVSSGLSKTIKTQASYRKAYTDLQVQVTYTGTDVVINSWTELAHF